MVRAEYDKPPHLGSSQDARVHGRGLENGVAKDEFVSFFITNLDKPQRNKLSVMIRYELSTNGNYDVPYSIFDQGNGSYRVSYRRDVPGNYHIDASTIHDGNQVLLASKRVSVNSDFSMAAMHDHILHCVDPDRTVVTFEERAFSFLIQTKNWRGGPIKEGGLNLSADMKCVQDKSDVELELVDLKDGTYRVNFQPTKSGRYSLDLGLKDHHGRFNRLKGSPFEGSVLLGNQAAATIDPIKTRADWSKFKNRTANDVIKFLLEAIDQRGNEMVNGGAIFEAKVISPLKKELPIIIIDHEDGSYTGTFNPKASGRYEIQVTVKNEAGAFKHIAGSPHSFSVAAPEFAFVPELTTCEGPGLIGGQTGKYTHFVVEPRNARNLLVPDGEAKIVVKITYGHTAKDVPSEIRVNPDGTFHVSYCPKFHGRYSISVSLVDNYGKKLAVKGSPFLLDIDPSLDVPYANNCTAYGIGMVSAQAGQESVFYILARNISRQDIPAKVSDFQAFLEDEADSRIPMTLSENADGTLIASYAVSKPGYYRGYVLLAENEESSKSEEDRYISCAPFMVEVLDKLSLEKTQVLGLEKNVSFFVAPTTFTIDTKNAAGDSLNTGGETFDIDIKGPKDTLIYAGVTDNVDGTYDVTFRPVTAGPHSIWIYYNGDLLPACPYNIDVEEAADSTQSSTSKYMFVVQMRTKDGKDKQEGGDFFEVTISGPDGDVDEVQIMDVGDGSIYVQYILHKPGEYWVKALLNHKPLQGFPFLHVIPNYIL